MTYHAGIGPRLKAVFGNLGPREPHVTCDGCGLVESAVTRDGGPKAWLLNLKAPKGWLLQRTEEPFMRKDWCPKCRIAKATRVVGEGR
jgi:hypothetical protein